MLRLLRASAIAAVVLAIAGCSGAESETTGVALDQVISESSNPTPEIVVDAAEGGEAPELRDLDDVIRAAQAVVSGTIRVEAETATFPDQTLLSAHLDIDDVHLAPDPAELFRPLRHEADLDLRGSVPVYLPVDLGQREEILELIEGRSVIAVLSYPNLPRWQWSPWQVNLLATRDESGTVIRHPLSPERLNRQLALLGEPDLATLVSLVDEVRSTFETDDVGPLERVIDIDVEDPGGG